MCRVQWRGCGVCVASYGICVGRGRCLRSSEVGVGSCGALVRSGGFLRSSGECVGRSVGSVEGVWRAVEGGLIMESV